MMTPTYLIVGSGFVARHFQHYLSSLHLKHSNWTRSQGTDKLQDPLNAASHVLLLISDDALEDFYQRNLKGISAKVVHFSGALEIPGMIGAHPLMTFAKDLYPADFYPKIPFVLTEGKMEEILPGLPNKAFHISPEQKQLYHALCVLGGNFTFLLWEKMMEGFKQMGLPASAAFPYLEKVLENFKRSSEPKLTGPLARKDILTLQKNMQALDGDQFQKIYRAFAETKGLSL